MNVLDLKSALLCFPFVMLTWRTDFMAERGEKLKKKNIFTAY
jgi:hypothetical protein